MRREVKTAAWEVAGPTAYPMLIPMHTPAGGISSDQLKDLTTLLGAIPRFVEPRTDLREEWITGTTAIRWPDPVSGATLVYDGPWIAAPPLPWLEPSKLRPCNPEGPNATPGAGFPFGTNLDDAALAQHEIVAGFERWLQRPAPNGGLSAA